jgi:preprotein translocase subunit SecF
LAIIVALFMLLYYRLPGLLADLALILYSLIVFAVFKVLGVTLTLAGIAGFILSIGMAVDANVLVFERMRGITSQQDPGRGRGGGVPPGLALDLDLKCLDHHHHHHSLLVRP